MRDASPTVQAGQPEQRRSFCSPTEGAGAYEHLDELGNLLRSSLSIFEEASDSFTSAQWGAFFLLRQSMVIVSEMEEDEARPKSSARNSGVREESDTEEAPDHRVAMHNPESAGFLMLEAVTTFSRILELQDSMDTEAQFEALQVVVGGALKDLGRRMDDAQAALGGARIGCFDVPKSVGRQS